MIIYDPLYGDFDLPPFLCKMVDTPEVRRLSQIRLLNTMSPALATLGELRRYSHTLGVVFLARLPILQSFSEDERKAFAATAMLHDIGTAPFAHLFEYHLKELVQWDHESEIRKILLGTHAPENKAHQLFYGRTIGLAKALGHARVSRDIVLEMVQGVHPLSRLLFGTLDLDNLDNIARMAWALGLESQCDTIRAVATHISIRPKDASLYLPLLMRPHVEAWARVRRRIYDILVFDPPTVAAQATLSAAIRIAIESNLLGADDWSMTDEQLLNYLASCEQTKGMICNEYYGHLPSLAFAIHLPRSLSELGVPSRDRACKLIESALLNEYDGSKPLGYVFEDRGTFEKELCFRDPESGETWSVGTTSRSVILYGFLRTPRGTMSKERTSRAIEHLANDLGMDRDELRSFKRDNANRSDHEQRTFDYAP